ncbi:HXXEE domain-containing protein [Actinomyces sp. 432]|uniref:HXXEE domain-containing protein n=1 Tax=unclassified Actinomyces TaxID=2609248 RepID=UPI001374543E|nr:MULTISPECIES: HXXEE domain-containing protein [unclassified Actinomyces]MBW3069127.1 HXXEE domain-containing protein [Actinomyces sp. 594]QHO91558.1 HXXEE domain-containing protein [Actinomyces sp. 432]
MGKTIVNNWHYVSVYLAGGVALAAIFIARGPLLTLQIASVMVLFLHFFEEFGFPGGFPFMGVKVLMGSGEMDSSKWDCNNLNSMYGNWGFLLLVYILPIIVPGARPLVLAAMLFNVAEILMHLVVFNVRLRTLYNPGMVTAVVGLTPIAVRYFTRVFDSASFMWFDWVIAVAWLVAVFWLCFRSPVYWGLGRKPGFALTDRTAYGAVAVK